MKNDVFCETRPNARGARVPPVERALLRTLVAPTAVAKRRGGLPVANTHPEASGFCPSREGI